jgi:hypothetical protein
MLALRTSGGSGGKVYYPPKTLPTSTSTQTKTLIKTASSSNNAQDLSSGTYYYPPVSPPVSHEVNGTPVLPPSGNPGHSGVTVNPITNQPSMTSSEKLILVSAILFAIFIALIAMAMVK